MRELTSGRAEVLARGRDLMELLGDLERQFPGFKARLTNDSEQFSNLVNIFVNEVDFHDLAGAGTSLKDGDRVRLAMAPLISGGSQP